MANLRHYWLQLNASLWFVPLLSGIAALALALWAPTVRMPDGLEAWGALFWGGDLRGARELFSSLLGGMITMTSLVVSITVVVLSLAAQQLGPRLIRSFTEDRVTQCVIGLFVGTILYLLVVLRTLEGADSDAAPAVAVTIGTASSAACLFALLIHVHRLATSIVSDTIAERITADLLRNPAAREPNEAPPGPRTDQTIAQAEQARGAPVLARRSGYLQSVDYGALVRIASEGDVLVRMARRPGSWVVRGTEVAHVLPPGGSSERLCARVLDAIVFGSSRTSSQDVEYDLQRLVEIAVRALSPGVNDPFTAIVAIDNLGACLAHLFGRPPTSSLLLDDRGVPRVLRRIPDWRGRIDVSFDQIRQAGAPHPAVMLRLLETIAMIAPLARDDEQFDALRAQVDAIVQGADAAGWVELDRRALRARHAAANAALGAGAAVGRAAQATAG